MRKKESKRMQSRKKKTGTVKDESYHDDTTRRKDALVKK